MKVESPFMCVELGFPSSSRFLRCLMTLVAVMSTWMPCCGRAFDFFAKYFLEPQTAIYKWLLQLDDEPNLYIGNGWKSPFPFLNGCLGFQVGEPSTELFLFCCFFLRANLQTLSIETEFWSQFAERCIFQNES